MWSRKWKVWNSILEGTGKVVLLPGDETVLPVGNASFCSGSMSLPQPACGEPLSPVHVLEVWFIHKCFPYELFHSCEPGFLIVPLVRQFLYLIFQEEVWKQRAHKTITLLWVNICFSLFQEEVWCDEPTQPLHSSGWTPASEWGNPHSSNIQRFVWGEVWASGESWSRD